FQLLLQYFYSDVIVPIFNKQTPLEAGELRDAIESFARKADFKLSNIYVLNESKRTSHANAYFTGFGSRKRIVLYDSLIEKLSTQEIVAVLAHEIGHYKHRHNIKNIITSLIISLGILAAFNAVIANEAIAQAAGCSTPSFHVNLVVFSLLLDPLTTVLGIMGNAFSRRDEWQADEFAKVHGMASHLSSALKSLAKSNLSNLTPHPLYVIFNYSHPTMLQRIEHLTQQ
ncbi:MAG: M48 family metallopeptidase, partial [Muribaculaceae bacterium]